MVYERLTLIDAVNGPDVGGFFFCGRKSCTFTLLGASGYGTLDLNGWMHMRG